MNRGIRVLQTLALPLGYVTIALSLYASYKKMSSPLFYLIHLRQSYVNMAVSNGAGDETRTRYLHHGKVALYQMSYARKWCPEPESNQRHGDFQSPALPTELSGQVASRIRLELTTSSVTGWRSNQLNYRAITATSLSVDI